MKRSVFVLFFVALFLVGSVTSIFAIFSTQMTFGGMSDVFPKKEFAKYWEKAYPEMVKIHGPAYSSFTFRIEDRPDLKEHEGGWDPINKVVMESGSALDGYKEMAKISKDSYINSFEQGVTHELSHAMYTHGNVFVGFPIQWINEGWAKTTELISWMRVKKDPPRPGLYLSLLMDRDTVAGTYGFGSSKQKTNHGLIYDQVSAVHLNLLYGCSSSNVEPDFQKNIDQEIYDEIVVTGKYDEFGRISMEQYKKIVGKNCSGNNIDGEDAIDWYFNSPPSLIKGTTGFHIGVSPRWWAYTTVDGLDVYTFNRVSDDNNILVEKGVKANVKVEVADTQGNIVYVKSDQTDQDGVLTLNFGRDFLKDGAYYISASSDFQGKKYQANLPFISVRDADGTWEEQANDQDPLGVIGIVVNKNLQPLDSRYLSVLKTLNGANITANSNGLFLAEVPGLETKNITFDYLGKTFDFTKPPFRRVVVLKVSDDLIKMAEKQNAFTSYIDTGFPTNKTRNMAGLRDGLIRDIMGDSEGLNIQKVVLAFGISLSVVILGLLAFRMFSKKTNKAFVNNNRSYKK